MREADLRARLASHLGDAYSLLWSETVVLEGLGHRTVSEALARGTSCKQVWLAAWTALELPHTER